MIWGIPGALLSTPIISIIKIVCENIPVMQPIAILIGSAESVRKLDMKAPEVVGDVVETVKKKIAETAKKVRLQRRKKDGKNKS